MLNNHALFFEWQFHAFDFGGSEEWGLPPQTPAMVFASTSTKLSNFVGHKNQFWSANISSIILLFVIVPLHFSWFGDGTGMNCELLTTF